MQEENKRTSIGALWKKTSQKGEEYLVGEINGQNVVIFTNKDKKEKQPDYRVYPRKPKEETQNN